MNQKSKTELLGMELPELEDYMVMQGEQAYRGRQIYKWIYQSDTGSFYDMSDLPRDLRTKLDERAQISIPRVLKQKVSEDGTRKFLLDLEDKKKVETVLIPQTNDKNGKYTICISTQVGCPIGCAFCATGQSGFQRNLMAHEIVGQVLGSRRELRKKIKAAAEPLITNVVYMGMGEPMLNYDEMIKSVRLLNHHKGINIGQRHITISTAGEVRGIERLAQENLQVTLAVSLHAGDNELRNRIVPLNRKYPLEILMKAIDSYIEITNRRVTFEYIMLDDVNISRQDAARLVNLVKPRLAHVNLIPFNEVPGIPFKRPSDSKVRQFYEWVERDGIEVTLREERGADIEAACGQLAVRRNDRSSY